MKAILIFISLFNTYSSYAQSKNLDLAIYQIRNSNPSYEDFCNRWPGECDLSGPEQIQWNTNVQDQFEQINDQVNQSIEFKLDEDLYDIEEFWNYPTRSAGDCEDNALEKRRQLVNLGYPRGALRMTTAFHKSLYYAHALLLIETNEGTYVLDQDADDIVIWYDSPYIFESRERTDGRWERFEQDWKRLPIHK